ELVSAKQEGFSSEWLTDNGGARPKKRQLVVIGVMTVFGNKNNRDAVRKAWMGSGIVLHLLLVCVLFDMHVLMFDDRSSLFDVIRYACAYV
ncbi:hypothetical protein LINPERPRIM_LOCUS12863, partial [Linum perenne]